MLQTLTPTHRQNDGEKSPASLIAADASISTALHREPVESVIATLESDAARGLSRSEAQRRLDRALRKPRPELRG